MEALDVISMYTSMPELYDQNISSTNICSATVEASEINTAIIKSNKKSSIQLPTKSDCSNYDNQIFIKELYAANTFELGNKGEKGFFFLSMNLTDEAKVFGVEVKRFGSKPPTFQALALQSPIKREVIPSDIIMDTFHILHPTNWQRVKNFIIDILAQF